jgi:hypothetical protein
MGRSRAKKIKAVVKGTGVVFSELANKPASYVGLIAPSQPQGKINTVFKPMKKVLGTVGGSAFEGSMRSRANQFLASSGLSTHHEEPVARKQSLNTVSHKVAEKKQLNVNLSGIPMGEKQAARKPTQFDLMLKGTESKPRAKQLNVNLSGIPMGEKQAARKPTQFDLMLKGTDSKPRAKQLTVNLSGVPMGEKQAARKPNQFDLMLKGTDSKPRAKQLTVNLSGVPMGKQKEEKAKKSSPFEVKSKPGNHEFNVDLSGVPAKKSKKTGKSTNVLLGFLN